VAIIFKPGKALTSMKILSNTGMAKTLKKIRVNRAMGISLSVINKSFGPQDFNYHEISSSENFPV
jgi:hypothetical protein